jgi:hypothetical protein
LATIEQVLKQNPSVRFAAVIGPDGKIIKGEMRSRTKSLEPASKAEQLYLQWTTMHKSGHDWNKYLGARKYLLDKRERVHIYTFNLDDSHVLLVSTDPVDGGSLGDEILDLIAIKNGETGKRRARPGELPAQRG